VFSTGGCTESIEFSRSNYFRVGLDEGSSVITHWLVASVWVLGDQSIDGGDKDQDQEDKGKDGVHDEEDDTQDTTDESGFLEDAGEDHQKYSVDKVDDADGNVEDVDLAIHPWPQVRNSDKVDALNENKSDTLNGTLGLGECNEDTLDEDISKHGDDPVVARTFELDVEETPSVEGSGVRVKDNNWALVHVDRVLSKSDDLVGSPR